MTSVQTNASMNSKSVEPDDFFVIQHNNKHFVVYRYGKLVVMECNNTILGTNFSENARQEFFAACGVVLEQLGLTTLKQGDN